MLFVVGGGALAMLGFIFFGYQLRDINVLIAGVLFLSSLIVNDALTDGRYLRSPGKFGALSFAYWLPVWVGSLLGGVGKLRLSFLSAPTAEGAYLSALSGASPPVQAFINRWAAPIFENLLLASITWVTWKAAFRLLDRYLPTTWAGVVATFPAAGIFVGLHGIRTLEFRILAFGVAVLMLAPIFLEDHLSGNQTWWLPMSGALMFGVHRSINIQNGGGYLVFVSDMLQATPPLLYANGLALGIELVTFVAAVWFAGAMVNTAIDSAL